MSFVGGLQIGSAVCAFVAAFFWFRSATTDAPPMTYEGSERLKAWLDKAAQNNRWAAGFAGISALLAGIATSATDPSMPSAPGANAAVIPLLSLGVAALAVFVARTNVQSQLQVTARETWMRDFRQQVAAMRTSRQALGRQSPKDTTDDPEQERRREALFDSYYLAIDLVRLLLAERTGTQFETMLEATDRLIERDLDPGQKEHWDRYNAAVQDLLRRERAAIVNDTRGWWRALGVGLGFTRRDDPDLP
jgi:hypothetical protein